MNYRERRLLAELARRLRVEDPGLARQLSQPRTATGLPRWILDLVLILWILLMPLRWKPALNAFAITFEGRIYPAG